MKKKMRRKKLTVIEKIMLALILLGKNWRTIGAAIGGALMLIGMASLITADAPLYVDYSVALKYLAKCWAAIIGGGAVMALCMNTEEVTR